MFRLSQAQQSSRLLLSHSEAAALARDADAGAGLLQGLGDVTAQDGC